MKRLKPNYRFLAILFISLAILCTSTYFVHGYQVRRNAGALLQQAETAQKADHLQDAANYLGQYVGLFPRDADGLARLGLLLADQKMIKSPQDAYRAKSMLDRALYFNPDRDDVRREAIRIALGTNDYGSAGNDIKRLLKKSPQDGELKGMEAFCCEQSGKFGDARVGYEESIKLAPKLIDTYVKYAALLQLHTKEVQREKDKETVAAVHRRADEVINSMVTANPNSPQAYLYRAEYAQRFLAANDPKASEQIAQDIAKARELNPDGAEVLIAAANHARNRGELDEARKLFKRGCELHPDDYRQYLSAARIEELSNQPEASVAVLRQGLAKLPNNYDLLWQLADVLAQQGKPTEALDALAKLKRLGVPAANCDVLEAQLLVKDQKWSNAAEMLEKAVGSLNVRRGTANDALTMQLAIRGGLALAYCYEQMGDFDRAFAAYNRIVTQDPRSMPGILGLAGTLNAMGRQAEALDQYRQLISNQKGAPIALVEIARLTFIRNVGLDAQRQNWVEVDKAIRDAEELLVPVPVQIVLLRADMLSAKGDVEAARKHLLDKYPELPTRPLEVWAGLAMLDANQNRFDSAIALLDQARQYQQDSIVLQIIKARLLARQTPKDVASIVKQLESENTTLSKEARQRWLGALVEIAAQAGEFASAMQILDRLAADHPKDLRYQLLLFDLASKNNDEAALQRSIDNMKQIEKEGGVIWRFATASKLVGQAARGDKSIELDKARLLLQDVLKRRPNWIRAELCLAQLDDLEGNSEEALAAYQRQINRGEREPAVIRRAVELLFQKRRYAEAHELFGRIPNPELLSQDFSRLGSTVALSANKTETALRLAETTVASGSKDFQDQIWLGRVYLAANQKDKAGLAFEEARKRAPTEAAAWVNLIQFLVATGEKDRAVNELAAAKKQLSGPAATIAFASCHEVLGQTDQAREYYKAGATASPDDAAAIRAIAEFYFRNGQMAEAIPHLRRLGIELKDKNPLPARWARQTLALALALQGDPRNTDEALQLLKDEEKAAPRGTDLSGVERTRATILAMSGTQKSRQDALQILEKLIERRSALPADHFLAAQLYEALDKWPQARRRFLSLLEMPGGDTPAHQVAYCRSLLRHGGAELARPIINQLEAQNANAWPVQELNARLLHAQGKTTEAVKLLESVTQDETRLAVVAGLLNEFKAFDAAEVFFRRLADKPNQPLNSLALAQFLTNRRKYAEAIDICDRIWPDVPMVQVAEIAIAVLSELPPNSREFGTIERRLGESMKKEPDNSELLVAMANVRNFQGRYDEAEQLYRTALAKNPRQGTALNNLAWIIALRGGNASEALELIARAMEIAGPDPGLLDTRGVAYLALKQARSIELAIKDFQTLVDESSPSASTYFHLAQAYIAAGKRVEAKKAWQDAKKRELSAKVLHPLERPAYEQMSKELN